LIIIHETNDYYSQGVNMPTRTFEIYFDDLNPEAQRNLLATFGTTEEEENWDIFSLATIEKEDEENE